MTLTECIVVFPLRLVTWTRRCVTLHIIADLVGFFSFLQCALCCHKQKLLSQWLCGAWIWLLSQNWGFFAVFIQIVVWLPLKPENHSVTRGITGVHYNLETWWQWQTSCDPLTYTHFHPTLKQYYISDLLYYHHICVCVVQVFRQRLLPFLICALCATCPAHPIRFFHFPVFSPYTLLIPPRYFWI